MPTPTGTITLSDVNIELCRSPTAQINMNDPDVRSLAGIPSGAISMNDLRGKTFFSASLANLAGSIVSRGSIGPGETSSAGLTFTNDGNFQQQGDGGFDVQGAWISSFSCGGGSAYEVFASLSFFSGPIPPNGTFNQWVNLGIAASWSVVGFAENSSSFTPGFMVVDFTLRKVSNQTIMGTRQISFDASF